LSQYFKTEATDFVKPTAPVSTFALTHSSKTTASESTASSAVVTAKAEESISASGSKEETNKQQNRSFEGTPIFIGKRFRVIGFDTIETQSFVKMLEGKGAHVVSSKATSTNDYGTFTFSPPPPPTATTSNEKNSIDYTLLPMTIHSPIAYDNPCTVYWLVSITLSAVQYLSYCCCCFFSLSFLFSNSEYRLKKAACSH
jgi:hypothetical protein